MENSLINKGKTHSLYTFRHMNPQNVKFQLFWVIWKKSHVFLAFEPLDGPYIQIDIILWYYYQFQCSSIFENGIICKHYKISI